MSHIHWVPRQNKLEIPNDEEEVNIREIYKCDGQTHNPDTMVAPLFFFVGVGVSGANANDELMFRAQVKSLGERDVITNKVALEAEKARDELHNQIEQIEQRL